MVERASGLNEELNRHGRDKRWIDVWRQVGQLCQDPEFFALSESRNASDTIQSVDRMVSSLLSHEGLSKLELKRIIEGISDELSKKKSELPLVHYNNVGAELDCTSLDEESIRLLAKTMIDLFYLKNAKAGSMLIETLDGQTKNSFIDFIKLVLKKNISITPKIGTSKLDFYFDGHKND